MFLREIYPKKKVQQRETLVPKSIQFEGNKYDGLSEGYIFGRGLVKGGEWRINNLAKNWEYKFKWEFKNDIKFYIFSNLHFLLIWSFKKTIKRL